MSTIDPKDYYQFNNEPSPTAEDNADAEYERNREYWLRQVLGDDMTDSILARPVEKADQKKKRRRSGQEQLDGNPFPADPPPDPQP